MNNENKEQLIAQFRAYLEFTDSVTPSSDETEARSVDLYTLFCELAAIKNEVKLESRQVKQALEQFSEVFSTLQDANTRLSTELGRSQTDNEELRKAAQRELLIDILDLRDRLAAGLRSARKHRPGLLARLRQGDGQVHAVLEGAEITLNRLDSLLQRHDVKPIPAVGKPFDPNTMRALEVERRHDQSDGAVIAELRKGFLRDDIVLRLAEVVVNKRETSP